MKKYLTVSEFAKKANVSNNLIYYYIKNDLLPQPKHIPRDKVIGKSTSGGVKAVYHPKYLKRVELIRGYTKAGKSILEIKSLLKVPIVNRQTEIISTLETMLLLAKNGKFQEEVFSDELENLTDITSCMTLNQASLISSNFSDKKG